jgi:beta-aspartyl-peptidase (threonine type)
MLPTASKPKYALVIHGGAGVVSRASLLPDQETLIRSGLSTALTAGERILQEGGSALDAVVASVTSLEDCPWFNAGRGSVLNRNGICEMDAAVMEGHQHRAGAVASVHRIRNPIQGARAVMERSPHVLLCGEGADQLAADSGLALEPTSYFVTEGRRKQWERITGQLNQKLPSPESSLWSLERKTDAFGTVGAVALDAAGNLAAATSTGGLAGKTPGRVGDSPLIGAGTYADNATCAISGTGHGEHFIRQVLAHDVAARIRYAGQPLQQAAHEAIHQELSRRGGDGGLIGVNVQGEIVMPFNTSGMYRAWVRQGEPARSAIYPD